MKILIITGGYSERKISLMSADKVKNALKNNNHKVGLYNINEGLDQVENIVSDHDVIFPVIHGFEGEDGALHKFLSRFKKPIVGSRNHKGFKQGYNKIPFKEFCEENSILTSPWKKVKSKGDVIKFGFPSVLKSSRGGSSIEVIILKSKKDLSSYNARKLLSSNLDLFVEKYLPGIEVTVGILNNEALPMIEIIPPKDGWFDYKNKYSGSTREVLFAPSLSKDFQSKIQKMALEIHRKLDLGEYSRIDFIVFGDKAYVLEVNTIPGMTDESLLPKAASAAGIPFEDLCERLVMSAK